MPKKPITIGTPVAFDSEHGPQTGTVADIKSDIGNGQSIAIIQVAGCLDNTPWQMPLNQLQRSLAAA